MQTITLSGTTYNLQATTGKVLSTNKNLETKVSGGGGGGFARRGSGFNSPVRITSTTTVHDQIFIEDKNGKEHSFQLSGYDLAARENNTLSVLAAFKENKDSGTYFAVINHSTDKIYYKDLSVKSLCGPNKFILMGIAVIAFFIGFNLFSSKFIIAMMLIVVGLLIYYFVTLAKNTKILKSAINPSDYNHNL
jgi:hypothetical protein